MAQYQDDFEKESMQPAGNAGKKAGKKAGKAALKAAGKLAKALVKKLVLWIISLIGVPLLIGLGLILLMFLTWNILFEFQGTQQQYTTEYESGYIIDENGQYITTEELMSPESVSVRDFYIYNAGISYYQVVGKDNTKLISPDDEGAVQDYYKSADMFKLNSNLLFSLDKYLFEGKVIYPEQFIKPVQYNPDTMTLVQLTDEEGQVTAQSDEIDLNTGEKTGNKITSVRDYGLATVVSYNQSEDWKKTVKLKWTYDRKDVWDDNLKKVVTVSMAPEKGEKTLSQERIHLVEKVISFAGEIQYNYAYQESKMTDLRSGTSTNKKDPVEKVLYDTYTYKECYYEKDEDGNQKMNQYGMPIQVCKPPVKYNLYKYRDADSGIYENVPVQTGNTSTEKGTRYLYDYIENFESYIPSTVMEDFNFEGRIDYDSIAFDVEGLINEDYMIEMGGEVGKKKFNESMRHINLVKKHSAEFGISDPMILIAMMSQESGGKANINKNGLMQITSDSYTVSQTALNAQGVKTKVSIDLPDRQDPDKSIRYAAAYVKRLMDKYDGNVLKAIQAFNFGEGTLNYIKNNHPQAWNDEYAWLAYREEARLNTFGSDTRSASYDCTVQPPGKKTRIVGDTCYLENVLRYYSGDGIPKVENQGNAWTHIASTSGSYNNFNKTPVEGEVVEYYDFAEDVNREMPEIILRTTAALDNREHFSEVEDFEKLNFWDEGFMSALGTVGIGLGDIENLTGYYGGYAPPIVMGPGLRVSSPFGNRMHPIFKELRFHKGIDVAAPTGTPLYAIADGTIDTARFGKGYGNHVKIKHENSTETLYAHLNGFAVTEGMTVVKGQVIGYVGSTGDSTGPHLHFELHVNGSPVDPISLVDGDTAKKALEIALTKIGSPYVWGAYGPETFDCSGLVLWSYRQVGYKGMPRTTKEQYKVGESVGKNEVMRGDLIYFLNGSGGPVDHVGIYLGKENGVDKMLHAPRPGKTVEITNVNWSKAITIRRHK